MSERTVPVSIFAADRAIVRAIAGSVDELPAETIRRAIQALLDSDTHARSVAKVVAARVPRPIVERMAPAKARGGK